MELVPGNLINLELKDFDWYLVEFAQGVLNIQIRFADPTVISYDQHDTLMITFQNTQTFLQPAEGDISPIPDGY